MLGEILIDLAALLSLSAFVALIATLAIAIGG